MKIVDKITMAAERTVAVVSTQAKHYAPEIEFGLGACLVLFGAVSAYKAGKKSQKNGYKEQFDEEMKNLESGLTPKSIRSQAKRSSLMEYAWKETKNVAPAVICTGGGLIFMKKGFDRVKRSNMLLEAALASSVAAYKKLDEQVVLNASENDRDILLTEGREETVDTIRTNELGEQETYKNSYLVTELFDLPGEAFIYSKETCIGQNFQENDDYFRSLVVDAEAMANRRLNNTHGYCFDADIVKLFSVEPKPMHYTCGSVMPDPKHKRPGDDKRSGMLTLYTRKIDIQHDDGSRSFGWLIIPKSDGSIIDIYQKYSLQRLLMNHRNGIKERTESDNHE